MPHLLLRSLPTKDCHRPGFSLLELLTVVAVIVILVGLTFPVLRMARGQARQVKCIGNQRLLTLATIAYAQEEQGYLPYGHDNGPPWWTDRVGSYLDNSYQARNNEGNVVFHCPFAITQIPNHETMADRFSFHYSMNLVIYHRWIVSQNCWDPNWGPPVRISRTRPNTVVIADGNIRVWAGKNYFWDFGADYPWQLQGSLLLPGAVPDPQHIPIVLHRGVVNVSHVDGHVDSAVNVWDKTAQQLARSLNAP